MNKPVDPAFAPTAAEATTPFYISASASIQEAWPRVLKDGNTFAMFDQHGDIPNATQNPGGIFHEDTRYLSSCYLLIEGHRPMLLSSTVQNDNVALTADLANPDIYRGDEIVLSREMLHIIRTKFLWNATCYERIAIENYDLEPHETRLVLRFGADFADLFEVRGKQRARKGSCRTECNGYDRVMFHYRGLDGVDRYTQLTFDPPPSQLDQHHAAYDLKIAPDECKSLVNMISFSTSPRIGGLKFIPALIAGRKQQRKRSMRAAVVSTSNDVLNQVLCRSVSDLYMLVTDTEQGPYPYAGIPWYSTAFGRDGIITALQMLWLDPTIALGVLRFLAYHQARDVDRASDAEPGKILHEMRRGEMAALGEVPFRHYYGTVDATPLFVLLAGKYFERTGDRTAITGLWPNIKAALKWMDTFGDIDGDGFVEYSGQTSEGLSNQGWKDSKDSIFHADGTLARGPIALCEVQAYVFAAKRAAAKMSRALGDAIGAAKLEQEAENLQARFEKAFWCEDIGTYALALDGDKKPCAVRASNAGHALFGGIASNERARQAAGILMRRDSFSGWGIRTLATSEKRFNPISYHNGSVWPHDNSMIALGFAQYGLKPETLKIFSGLFSAVQYMEIARLPELFCGFAQRSGSGPTLYPVACAPQAWAAATPMALLQACLGMTLDCANNEIRFERPLLPSFINSTDIRNLQLGNGRIDLGLQRHGQDVVVDVLFRTGDIRVVTIS